MLLKLPGQRAVLIMKMQTIRTIDAAIRGIVFGGHARNGIGRTEGEQVWGRNASSKIEDKGERRI